jgi:hypothetical protein
MDIAVAICAAYNEKPDECELSWKIRTYQQGILKDFQDLNLPKQTDYIYEQSTNKMVSVGEVGQSRLMIYLVVTAILVVNFVVLILVRRRMKR